MRGDDRPVGEDDLQALVDGRLAPDRAAITHAFLEANPDLAARLRLDGEVRSALRGRLRPIADAPVPSRLRVAAIMAERRQSRRRGLGAAAAALVLLLGGAGGGWFAREALGGARTGEPQPWALMAGDALAAHRTYAVEIVHPVEVRAEQSAHLAQWLSKRLRRRLILPDLEPFGLSLVGGRLLPAGADVAALLMYADAAGARLTVYVRCGAAGESALRFLREGELSSFAWAGEGYGYVVAAPMERERLQSVARAVSQEFDLEAARSRRAL